MAGIGYTLGKAVAKNRIITAALVILVVLYIFWPDTNTEPKAVIPSEVTKAQMNDEACKIDHGERLQKATTLFNNRQFDQAAEMLYACVNSLSTEERDLYAKALTEINEAKTKLAEADMGWKYSEETDPMTSKTTTGAILRSSNSLALDSPYSGTNYAGLIIRKHPRHGTAVIFKIDQGQLMCNEISGCPVKVRFDDGALMNFTGTEPADHDPTIVFINNAQRFITAASKAKNILVQVNIFHNGAPVLEFYTPNPLAWKSAK